MPPMEEHNLNCRVVGHCIIEYTNNMVACKYNWCTGVNQSLCLAKYMGYAYERKVCLQYE